MLKYVLRYKFSILLAGFIALLSLLPSSSMPDSSLFSITFLDKIVHACMYASIGFVVLLEKMCSRNCCVVELLHLLSLFIFSALIEILQFLVIPSRSAEWPDLLANLAGLIVAWSMYRIYLLVRS